MDDKNSNRPFGPGEPWLGKRAGSENFYIMWFDAKSRQTKKVSTNTADAELARKALVKWISVKRELKLEDPSRVLLTLVLDRYYEEHGSKQKSKTQAKVARAKWKKFFGHIMVSELSVVRQEQFIEWLRDAGDSQNYIRRTLSVGKSALLRAVRRQELTSAPAIVMPKRKKSKKYRMTLQEAAALFNAATTDHLRTFLLLAFGTAQRPINILELTTDRIDIEHRRIDFNPPDHDENKKRRPVVAICNTLVPLLERLAPGFAITWKKNQKKPMKGIKTAFIAARDRAGLRKDIMPYTIRRTVATELRRWGVDVGEIAGLLGHTQPGFEITELYAEYSPEYMSSAMKAIDDYFCELEPLLNIPFTSVALEEQPRPEELRANCVPLLAPLFSQDVDFVVGVTGFEPATYTSRKISRAFCVRLKKFKKA